MESSALDCKKGKGKCEESTCSSKDVGLYIEDKRVLKELEDGRKEVGDYVPLAFATILNAVMTELVSASAYVAVGLACREDVRLDDVGVAMNPLGFTFNFIKQELDIDLKVDRGVNEFVKDVNKQGRGGFGGRERGRGCRGGVRRGGRKGKKVDFEKDAVTLVEGAVENVFASIYKFARMASKGKQTMRVKHVFLGAKQALPVSLFPTVTFAIAETIVSCACEGKLKLDSLKLANWLKLLGIMLHGGGRTRPTLDPGAKILFGSIQQGTAMTVLDKSFVDARTASKLVIEKGDVMASISRDSGLRDYFGSFPSQTALDGVPSTPVEAIAKKMDPNMRLTDDAVGYVSQLSSNTLQDTAMKTIMAAEERSVPLIKTKFVQGVVTEYVPQSIVSTATPMFKEALKSFNDCKKEKLPELDEDNELTEEVLLEFGAIDFEDEEGEGELTENLL